MMSTCHWVLTVTPEVKEKLVKTTTYYHVVNLTKEGRKVLLKELLVQPYVVQKIYGSTIQEMVT